MTAHSLPVRVAGMFWRVLRPLLFVGAWAAVVAVVLWLVVAGEPGG